MAMMLSLTAASQPSMKSSIGTTQHRATLISSDSLPSSTSNNSAVDPSRLGTYATVPQIQSIQPDFLVSRRTASTAAIAVPLSVISAIIILAGMLGYRTRRALARERSRESKSLILSQKDTGSEGYGTVSDIQRAMSVLSSRQGCSDYNRAKSILTFTVKREPRPMTRDPYFPKMTSTSSGSLYSHHIPVLSYSNTGTGKSLTAQYTTAGTVPSSETMMFETLPFSASNPDIPPSLVPSRMLPLHIRSESPGDNHPLPAPPPPISCLSPSDSTNVYDAIAARLNGRQ